MGELENIIIEEIKKKGMISFDKFMEMALYTPKLGYYMGRRIPWGRKGDYLTGPHLHRIFGALIAIQLKEFWELMGKPKNFFLVEAGPGDGTLAYDILSFIYQSDTDFFHSISYVMIEKNPYLMSIQKKRLTIFSNVFWFSHLSDLPPVKGVFLSNELFDSFPVKRVVMEEDLKEIFVTFDEFGFREIAKDAEESIKEYFEQFSVSFERGFKTEVCLKARTFLQELAKRLDEGFVLTIDYGLTSKEYFSHDRADGTLLCYYKHRFHKNPYINIGEQDITAHVNFSALKVWGEEAGLKTFGFAPLGTYLVSMGLENVIPYFFYGGIDLEDSMKIKALLVPEGIGESHRVMVQAKNVCKAELKGFRMKNMESFL
ncbi:MAG: SAM-dependent methyltransferase [Desulfobacterota bacterium]|nr:SAM-dependent methyltransferase [Thermodesulfobacteriota bacterium]MDW8002468.1 SAM-dependent methyltransferase [Deltaproteobacteria bacterium]